MNLVQILDRNERGTDYAIGDVHGSYDLILRAMDMANFDQSVDRIIGCGDYINRGPQSYRAAGFLRSRFVRGTRGNHEQNLIDLYSDGVPDRAIIEFFAGRNFNGMGWMSTVKPEVLQDIVDEVAKLPIVLELPTERGMVGFIHADVPKGMHWDIFKANIMAGDLTTIQCALEGRNRIKYADQSGVDGIDRLFVGHTVQEGGFAKVSNLMNIDSGAVFGELYSEMDGHLTMMNVSMCTQALALPKEPGLIDLRDAPDTPKRPFGKQNMRAR